VVLPKLWGPRSDCWSGAPTGHVTKALRTLWGAIHFPVLLGPMRMCCPQGKQNYMN
jgi:hypothetical protein